jgi:hypothetical protein
MNATRWQGLYRMANKNRRLKDILTLALTGSESGLTEETAADIEVNEASDDGSDSDGVDGDVEEDADDDSAQVAANVAAGKDYPLAQPA